MPNPFRRHTPSRRDSRRANNWKILPQNLTNCPQCGSPRLPHHVCLKCGYYNGELVFPIKTKSKEKK